MKMKFISAIAGLLATSAVWAVTPEDVNKVILTGDEEEAFRLATLCAEAGHVRCIRGMGMLYAGGHGVEIDNVIAMDWFLKAAVLGDAEAQYQAGMRYELGIGVDKDPAAQMKWLHKSANQNYSHAQYKLGLIHNTAKDYDQGFVWMLKAAMEGLPEAMYFVSLMSLEGLGTDKNEQDFISWMKKSAEAGYSKAQYELGIEYRNQDNGVEAHKWLAKASEQGHVKAQFNLGQMYSFAMAGVEENQEEAAKWWKMAAHQGHPNAQYNYGRHIALQGDRFNGDMWVHLSAEAGNESAKTLYTKLEAVYDTTTLNDIKARAALCKSSNYTTCESAH